MSADRCPSCGSDDPTKRIYVNYRVMSGPYGASEQGSQRCADKFHDSPPEPGEAVADSSSGRTPGLESEKED